MCPEPCCECALPTGSHASGSMKNMHEMQLGVVQQTFFEFEEAVCHDARQHFRVTSIRRCVLYGGACVSEVLCLLQSACKLPFKPR